MRTKKEMFYAKQINQMLGADMFLLYQELSRYTSDLPVLYEMFELGEFIKCESNPFNSADVSYQIVHGQFNLADPYFTVIDEGEHGSIYSFDDLELDNFLLPDHIVDAIMGLTEGEMEEMNSCGLRIEPYEEHVDVPLSLLEQIVRDYEAIDKDYDTWRQSFKKETGLRIKQIIQFNTED